MVVIPIVVALSFRGHLHVSESVLGDPYSRRAISATLLSDRCRGVRSVVDGQGACRLGRRVLESREPCGESAAWRSGGNTLEGEVSGGHSCVLYE